MNTMEEKKVRLTPTMKKALENAANGRALSYGMPYGRSFSGGFSGTLVALRRRGLVDAKDAITDAGRAALAKAGAAQ